MIPCDGEDLDATLDEQFEKPHIRRSGKQWVCHGRGTSARNRTPRSAYVSWGAALLEVDAGVTAAYAALSDDIKRFVAMGWSRNKPWFGPMVPEEVKAHA